MGSLDIKLYDDGLKKYWEEKNWVSIDSKRSKIENKIFRTFHSKLKFLVDW
jgi:hypothetical protein